MVFFFWSKIFFFCLDDFIFLFLFFCEFWVLVGREGVIFVGFDEVWFVCCVGFWFFNRLGDCWLRSERLVRVGFGRVFMGMGVFCFIGGFGFGGDGRFFGDGVISVGLNIGVEDDLEVDEVGLIVGC